MKRFAVFGGRTYPHRDRVWGALDRLLAKHGPFVLVHGVSSGPRITRNTPKNIDDSIGPSIAPNFC